MTPEIRPIREDELPAWMNAVSTGFLDRPDTAAMAAEVRPFWDLGRTWAAFDGPRLCGTFRSWGTEITVPGGARLPASAVSGVTVLPTHRRRGLASAMCAAEHAAARDRGEAMALLYAAEWPIYGRFGYGPATRLGTWTLDALTAVFREPAVGTIELLTPDGDALELVRGIFDQARLLRPGEIARRPYQWPRSLGLTESAWGTRWKGFLAVHRDEGGDADGYVRYRAEEKWEHGQPRGKATVDELQALTLDAYVALWRYLAEIDLVATVKAESRSPAEPLPWLLTDSRSAACSDLVDGLWVRLFDVPRALEARAYDREASLVLEVLDAEAPGGATRVRLEVSPEGASARCVEEEPDLTIPVAALGAAYLGGTRLRDAVLGTGFDEQTADALATADAIFRAPDEPWCSTFF